MDISANNIPYWMIEQTVPHRTDNKHSDGEGKKNEISKIAPTEKTKGNQHEKLKQRDQEVRAHENAHAAAAGPHAKGGPSYTFQTGEDGKSYAVGGHVTIDTSKESTPEETIQKMQQIINAAKAPAEPSAQDLKVASQAALALQEAREELAEKKKEEKESKSTDKMKLEEAYKGASLKTTFSVSA